LIDLHLHTTASDGRLTPSELVSLAHRSGLRTIAVTDHDTVAAIAEATTVAATFGMRVVPGIEITAVADEKDVHVLGYFFDPASESLAELLVKQRADRVTRAREIASRLAAAGIHIDIERLASDVAARPGTSIGRPQLAREMVRSGAVPSVQDAFDRWLATGRPAFVSRTGPSPAAVVEAIHAAGGIASLAHPGVTKRDDLIAPLAQSGLDAIEVYHSDHTAEQQASYRQTAARLGLLMSGGSDFHGDDALGKASRPQRSVLGVISLPPADFAALERRSVERSS
jgi:predicted metal-dependent phosphoesterase TrpH